MALFGVFVALDAVSLLPRVAGSVCQRNAISISIQGIINTIKRVFVVSFAPVLGFIAISGDINDLILAVLGSYATGVVLVLITHNMRSFFISYFAAVCVEFDETGRLFRSFARSFHKRLAWVEQAQQFSADLHFFTFPSVPKTRRVFFLSLWIFFFYSSSVFAVNIIAELLEEWSTVVLQMTGIFNSLGTLALAFFLEPRLARSYERQADLQGVLGALLLGRFFSVALLGPVFFTTIWIFV